MQNDNLTPQDNTPPAPLPAAKPDVSAARRRMLMRGGMAAPLIVTLASRPVLGCDCISPSETLSGALSHAGPKLGACAGKTKTYWQTLPVASWPVTCTTPFHNLFATGSRSGTRFFKADNGTSLTLQDVLNLSTASDDSGIGSLTVVAYLNLQTTGLVDPKAMTVASLQALWREWAVAGHYTPFAGATPWTSTQIIAYLSKNGIAP